MDRTQNSNAKATDTTLTEEQKDQACDIIIAILRRCLEKGEIEGECQPNTADA